MSLNLRNPSLQLLDDSIRELSSQIRDLPLYEQGNLYGTSEEVSKVIRKFYKSPFSPTFVPPAINKGTYPDAKIYNTAFRDIKKDLQVVMKQLSTLGSEVNNNYNDITTLVATVQNRLNNVASLLADYKIYTMQSSSGIVYYGDSFNDVSRIDITSSSVENSLAHLDQIEGIITLARESKKSDIQVKETVINSISNGVAGNNNEYGVPRRNDLNTVFDKNPDTWYEYESVGRNADSLVLAITIILDRESIINNIQITPVNFGTKQWVNVTSIDTSTNGTDFISIKDDLPITDWGIQDEENIFVLSPSTSKFSGVGRYSFTPRKAKYIRLVFEQTGSYLIKTASGLQKDRLAIGLKEIQISGYKYLDQSEMVSKEFTTSSPIKKLALLTNQNPEQNFALGKIQHQFSIDNGQSWNDISPLQYSDHMVKEIANIEQLELTDETAVIDLSDITSFSYRAILVRNSAAFSDDSLPDITEQVHELVQFPGVPPYHANLETEAIEGSVKVLDPVYGSVGKEDGFYTIGKAPPVGDIILDLPFENMDEMSFEVYVGVTEWELQDTLANSSASDKHYVIDYENKKIIFGDDTNGARPSSTLTIVLKFDRERLFIDGNLPHKTKLKYATTGTKDHISVYREAGLDSYSDVVKKDSRKLKLSFPYLFINFTGEVPDSSDFSVKEWNGLLWANPSGNKFSEYLTYIDGKREFYEYAGGFSQAVTDGCYSVDMELGIVYVPDHEDTRSSSTRKTRVTYKYQKREYVSKAKWDFDPSDDNYQTITIEDDSFGSELAAAYTTTLANGSANPNWIDGALAWNVYSEASDNTNNVGVKCIIPKSLVFYNEDGNIEGEWTEFPYIDGQEEFDKLESTDYKYSVDYETGVIYSAGIPFDEDSEGVSMARTCQFEFTNYFAEYYIGDVLEEGTDWEIGDDKKSIKLSDSYAIQLNDSYVSIKNPTLLKVVYEKVVTNREVLTALQPYYTPILKDYQFVTVTKEGITL